jgi:tetratricopeptide (TPR) repeat protein
MERYDEALADFNRAIELDESAWKLASRGRAYQAMGRYDEALADFSRAIELDPGSALALCSRGNTYQAMGRYGEALADFDRAMEIHPSADDFTAEHAEIRRLMGPGAS